MGAERSIKGFKGRHCTTLSVANEDESLGLWELGGISNGHIGRQLLSGANGHWTTLMRAGMVPAGMMNIAETTSSANVTCRREDCNTATHACDFDFAKLNAYQASVNVGLQPGDFKLSQ